MELPDNRFTKGIRYFSQPEDLSFLQSKVAHEDLARAFDINDGQGVNTLADKIFPPENDESPDVEKLVKALANEGDAITRHWKGPALHAVLIVGDCSVITLFSSAHSSPKCPDWIYISVEADTPMDVFRERIEGAGWLIGKDWEAQNKVTVNFALPSTAGIRIMSRKFDSLPLESIAENYTPSVISEAREIIRMLSVEKNGIVILNGPPGTGKSYLIRAILSELRGIRSPLICTPPQRFLESAGLLTDAILQVNDETGPCAVGEIREKGHVGTIVTMEDVGEMLMEDNVTRHVNETANLLNLSDGLMALMADAVFLLTFNHSLDRINPALTRPGRCLGQLTVGYLDRKQAHDLVKDRSGIRSLPPGNYTLAQVYEMRRTGRPLAPIGDRVGFRTA